MNNLQLKFVEQLPSYPYCCDDFIHGTYRKPINEAILKKNIQIDRPKKVYLSFDIDREGASEAHREKDLPEPTLVVINPENAHAHLAYKLSTGVWFGKRFEIPNNLKPVRYYHLVRSAYTEALGSDPSYSGFLIKNPLHETWRTIWNDVEYSLNDLASCVDLNTVKYKPKKRTFEDVTGTFEGQRNVSLFEASRQVAYQSVSLHTSYDTLYNSLLGYCEQVNTTFIPSLPLAEIKGICASVCKWSWQNRDKIRGKRKVLNLPADMPLSERYSKGAEYTNKLQKERTERKILDVCSRLKLNNEKITKVKVSKLVGISREELSRTYKHLFN